MKEDFYEKEVISNITKCFYGTWGSSVWFKHTDNRNRFYSINTDS